MFDNDTLLEAAVNNIITYVPRSIIPGNETQKLLDIVDKVAQLNMTELVDQIRDHFFNNPALPRTCNTNCRMAKVRIN